MSEEGSGNVGLLRGSCHDMEAFLRKQTELGGPLGPSGPDWPREYTNARNGHGLCHYPPAVRQAAAEREGYETTDDGRERPSTPSSVGPCIRSDEFRVRCRCLAAADAGQVQAGRRGPGAVAHDAQLHSRRGPRPALHVRKPLHAARQGSLVTSDQGFCGRVYFRISSPLRPEGNQRICPDAMRDVSALLRVAPPLPVLADSEGLNVADVVYRSGASGRGLQSTFERRSSSKPRPSRQPSCRQ